jgi:SAM-dependent methyltransferase
MHSVSCLVTSVRRAADTIVGVANASERRADRVVDGWKPLPCTRCGSNRLERGFPVTLEDTDAWTQIAECGECGLIRMSPCPTGEALRGHYGNDYGAFLGRGRSPIKQRVWDTLRDLSSGFTSPALVRTLTPLAARLAKATFDINIRLAGRKRLRVLDVGCGSGDILCYLQSRGCLVQGVDTDRRAADSAAQMGVPVTVGALDSVDVADSSLDVAIMCHSLEHVDGPADDLMLLGGKVRPGGEVHIAVPNGQAIALEVEQEAWLGTSFPLHRWFFKLEDLDDLLRRAGFEIYEASYGMNWKSHFRAWRALRDDYGAISATAHLIRLVAVVARDKSRRDVLRVSATKMHSPPLASAA